MSFVSFVGYFLIGLGPGLAIFLTFIAPKSFLVIVTLSSAFFWLITLILIALLWRAFLPLGASFWPYLPLLISAVGIQEGGRILYMRACLRLEGSLEAIAAAQLRPRLSVLDRIEIALAGGLGHGVAHSALFFLSLLTPALGPATFFVDKCPQMPLFFVAALATLALLLMHTFGMVVAFDGYSLKERSHQLIVPALHLGAALFLLVNFVGGGCLVSLPLVWTCTAVMIGVCGKLVWERTGQVAAPVSEAGRLVGSTQ